MMAGFGSEYMASFETEWVAGLRRNPQKGKYIVTTGINLSGSDLEKTDTKLWESDPGVSISPIPLRALLKQLEIAPESLETCHFTYG